MKTMMKIIRYSNYFFMVTATIGWGCWLYFKSAFGETPVVRCLVGLGFGFSYGASMVHWAIEIRDLKRMERQEKAWAEFMKNPPPFRCPDCGIMSHNPNDTISQYCGYCQAYKS